MGNTISANAHKAYLNSIKSQKDIGTGIHHESKERESAVKNIALGALKLVPGVGNLTNAMRLYGSDVSLVKGIEQLTGKDLSGLKKAAAVTEFVPSKLKAGAMGAMEGLTDFLAGGGAQVAGQKDAAKWIYEHSWSQDLSGSADVDEELNNGSNGYRIASDVITGIGNVGFQVGVGLATGGLASAGKISTVAAKGITFGTLFAEGAGSGTAEAVQKTGNVGWKENVAGLGSGAIEVATEMISPTGKMIRGKITGKTIDETAQYFAKHAIAKSIVKDFGGEFIEESSSYALNWVLQNQILKIDNTPFSLKEWAYEGIMGGLAGTIFSAPSQVSSIRLAKKTGAKVYAQGDAAVKNKINEGLIEVAALKERGLNNDNVKLAEAALAKLTTDDQLSQTTKEYYLGLAEQMVLKQNLSDQYTALAKELVEKAKADPATAQSMADAFNAIVNEAGGEGKYTAADFTTENSEAARIYVVAQMANDWLSRSDAEIATDVIMQRKAALYQGTAEQKNAIRSMEDGSTVAFRVGENAYAVVTKRAGTDTYSVGFTTPGQVERDGAVYATHNLTAEKVEELLSKPMTEQGIDAQIAENATKKAEAETKKTEKKSEPAEKKQTDKPKRKTAEKKSESKETAPAKLVSEEAKKESAEITRYRKYEEIRKEHPDSVVAMRRGNFYIVYGNDATEIAKRTQLKLLKLSVDGELVPSVAIPYEDAQTYFDYIEGKVGDLIVVTPNGKVQNRGKSATDTSLSPAKKSEQTEQTTKQEKTEAKKVKPEDLSTVEKRLATAFGIDGSEFTKEEWTKARECVPNIDGLNRREQARVLTLVRTAQAQGVNEDYMKGLARLSSVYGFGVVFEDIDVSGFYSRKNGMVVINPKNLDETFGHEIEHSFDQIVKDGKAEFRTDLSEKVKRIVGASVFDRAKAQYKADYDKLRARDGAIPELSDAELEAEATANVVGKYLSNMTLLKKIAATDYSLGRGVLAAIRRMKDKWTSAKAFAKENDSTAFAEYRKMTRIEKMLVEELKKAKNAKQTGTEAPSGENISYSPASMKDSDGNDLSAEQRKFFAESKARDDQGALQVVYHGTMSGEFNVFDASKASVEGDMGAGFYFSSSYDDVEANYENGGDDFTAKIERLAEQIESEQDIDYEEAKKEAEKQLVKESHLFEVYLDIKNPAYIGGAFDDSTILFSDIIEDSDLNIDDYEDENDYYEDRDRELDEKLGEVVEKVAETLDDEGITGYENWTNVLYENLYEGITISDLKEKLADIYCEDENGNLATNELVRVVVQSLGYDGIIDNSVVDKWGYNSKRKNYMQGIDEKTRHYIAFYPEQIKLTSNKTPTTSTDIRYSPAPVTPSTNAKYMRLAQDPQKNESELRRLVKEAAEKAGYTIKAYHGTDADFTTFDASYIGKDNKLGNGFYFSNSDLKINYKNVIEAYLSVHNPMTDESKKVSKSQWIELCKRFGINAELREYDIDTYVEVSQKVDTEKNKMSDFLSAANEILGVDGIVSKSRGSTVAFNSSQIKSADPVTYDNSGNIIPLSERFNPQNDDIRYSPAPLNTSGRVVTQAKPPRQTITEKITNAKGQLNRQGLRNALKEAGSVVEGFKVLTVNAQQAVENQLVIMGMTKSQAGALMQYARSARSHSLNAAQFKLADMTGEIRSDGFLKIIEPYLAKKGEVYDAVDQKTGETKQYTAKGGELAGKLYDEFGDYYAMLHALDRAAIEKNPYSGMSINEMKAWVEKHEKAHPDFKAAAEKLSAFNSALLDIEAQAGILSQETVDLWKKRYPHYLPMYVQEDGTIGRAPVRGSRNMEVRRDNAVATESDHRVNDALQNYLNQLQKRIRAAKFNLVLQEVYNSADGVNVVKGEQARATARNLREQERAYLDNPETENDPVEAFRKVQKGRQTVNEVSFFIDGKRVTMAVSDRIYTGLADLSGVHSSVLDLGIVKFVSKINDTFKKLVTNWNPFFAVKNIARDLQDGLLNSKFGMGEFLAMYKKNVEMMTTGKYSKEWELFIANGCLEASIFSDEFNTLVKSGKSGLEQATGVVGQFQHIKNFNTLTEALPRFTEFCLTLKHGGTIQQAIYNAADVTVNFSRSGVLTRILNKTVSPFLNPAVQGLDRVIRLFTENGIKNNKALASLLLKAVLLAIVPMALGNAMYGDDDEYKDMKDSIKENNYLFKVGDTWLKLPRGRVVSTISGLFNRSYKQLSGQETDWGDYGKNVLDQITPAQNVARTIWSPFKDVANNRTWYGTKIESDALQNYAVNQRYDENTSRISVWIGQLTSHFGLSPKEVNYLIDQYTGVIGDILLPTTTPAGTKGVVSYNFTVDPNTSSNLSNRFYDLYNKTMYKSNDGDIEAYYLKKRLDETKSAVSELFKEIKTINSSTELSNKEKVKQASAIRAMINQLYKTALDDRRLYEQNIKDALAIENSYAVEKITAQSAKRYGLDSDAVGKYALTFGGDFAKQFSNEAQANDYKADASKKTVYAEANRLTYGAEYALREYNSNVYDKAKTLNELGISYDEYYNYYMTARYYSGKTKKQKILAYLNGSGLSKSQIALMMYYSGYTAYADEAKKAIKASALSAERKKELLAGLTN